MSSSLDFWLLGGGSIAMWIVIALCYAMKDSLAIQQRVMQIPLAFGFLTLFANHPHFIISYKLAYGRGWKFIGHNWLALIAVPITLLAISAAAYFFYDFDLSKNLGSDFSFEGESDLGPLAMTLLMFSMYATVGWHYAKQAFGCMMVYSKYDSYPLSHLFRTCLKIHLFSIAALQFVAIQRMREESTTGPITDPRFPAFHLVTMHLPQAIEILCYALTSITALIVVGLMVSNYLKTKKRPSIHFLIPWIAIAIWWIPFFGAPEFILMVPFFHSIQYLPFAGELEQASHATAKSTRPLMPAMKLTALLGIGFLVFEMIPTEMDRSLATDIFQGPWFFIACFAVFINVHHFFIDSVIWKFDHPDVRNALFEKRV